jgi:hypothetical protein
MREVTQIMYTHISNCKKDKIKFLQKGKERRKEGKKIFP